MFSASIFGDGDRFFGDENINITDRNVMFKRFTGKLLRVLYLSSLTTIVCGVSASPDSQREASVAFSPKNDIYASQFLRSLRNPFVLLRTAIIQYL
jgi:hypothetical protein